MRKGLVEWVLVTAFLALAAAGAVALFGDELRPALGLSFTGGSARGTPGALGAPRPAEQSPSGPHPGSRSVDGRPQGGEARR